MCSGEKRLYYHQHSKTEGNSKIIKYLMYG